VGPPLCLPAFRGDVLREKVDVRKFFGVFKCQRERRFRHAKTKTFFPRRAPAGLKIFFRPLAAANSVYPVDRARFCVDFDKLSRRAAKTPLTPLLAGIKSATRPLARSARLEKARAQRRSDEVVRGEKTIGARSECKSGIKTCLGSPEPGRSGGPARWPAFSLVRGSLS
jgi:hypothetical protein